MIPKSPKNKVSAKAKPAPKRRGSVKNPQPPLPATEHSQVPIAGGNVKRQREDDTPSGNLFESSPAASGSGVANEPSPPKRMKTEWEDPSENGKKTESVENIKIDPTENIKTEEDASAFLEQMTNLIKRAAGEEGQESLTSDISETLDQILKGYPVVPEASDHGLSLGNLGEPSRTSPPPTKPSADEFVEFFDFSSFGTLDDDDNGSKAPTPDLMPSLTNSSPESATETDAIHHASISMDPKTEDMPDLLRLGTWKEIDGGESAYYQSVDWKWDSPMPTQEPPWAIFTS